MPFKTENEEKYDKLCHDFVGVVCALVLTIRNSNDLKEPVNEKFHRLSEEIADEIILEWYELREQALK